MKAVAELSILGPLKIAGLLKNEIRRLSKEAGLPTHGQPAVVGRLASRIYGERITKEKLERIKASEEF